LLARPRWTGAVERESDAGPRIARLELAVEQELCGASLARRHAVQPKGGQEGDKDRKDMPRTSVHV
jgi:hypothetical protein